jgi:hypothetical protein
LHPGESVEGFGNPLARYESDAQLGKSSDGEENGQENVEEGEEDSTDQAVVSHGSTHQEVSPDFNACAQSRNSSAGWQDSFER